MSTSNKGLLVVVGVGVAGAAALAAVYFTVISPRERDESIRSEVDRWGGRWQAARRCLVGDAPRAANGFEAMVLREITAEQDLVEPLRGCLPLVRALRREVGPESIDTGAEGEKAWAAAIGKVSALAEAHAWRISPRPNREPADLRRALARSIAELDRAYAALRAAAGLGVDPPVGPRLATLAAGAPVADAKGRPVRPLGVRVGAGALFARAELDGQLWLVRQAPGSPAELSPVGPEVIAAPGQGWGAYLEDGVLRAGPLDRVGDPATDGALLAAASPGSSSTPLAALVDGPVHAVVHESRTGDMPDARRHWVSRSRDGATWPERIGLTPPASRLLATYAQPELDRFDLVWAVDAGGMVWLPLGPGALDGSLHPRVLVADGAFEPGASRVPEPCVAGRLAWWNLDGVLHVIAPDGPARMVAGAGNVIGPWRCAGDRLLTVASGPEGAARIVLCRPSGCTASMALPGPGESDPAFALDPDRGPLVAYAADGLVVVWSGDPDRGQKLAPTAAARLGDGQRLVGILPSADALLLVTLTDDALRLIPMPHQLPKSTMRPHAPRGPRTGPWTAARRG